MDPKPMGSAPIDQKFFASFFQKKDASLLCLNLLISLIVVLASAYGSPKVAVRGTVVSDKLVA